MNFDTLEEVKLSNGETATYRQKGHGPHKILLLHGNMTSSKHWDLLAEALSDEFTIVAPDMRGFGGSTYNVPVSGLRDFSEDLRQFCDTVDFRGFTLVGWSTGGGIALQFAADHPGYADKIVLMSSMSTRGWPFFGDNEQGQVDPSRRLTTIEEIEALPRNRFVQDAYDRKDRETLRAIWNAAIYTTKQPEKDRYEAYLDDMLTQRNLMDVYHGLNTFNISNFSSSSAFPGTGDADRVQVPVLIVWGKNDLVCTEPMTRELMEDLPHARSVCLEKSGHSPLIDDLETLTNVISDFARS